MTKEPYESTSAEAEASAGREGLPAWSGPEMGDSARLREALRQVEERRSPSTNGWRKWLSWMAVRDDY